ncbi:DUF4279 domain-containing protein [Qipengyuania sp. XHP0207]|uniref:DUF4279 domain-containing protein n=1 Tax=Qipengyuania sp. XHP0207 TaxID=3038078 RepID=UPI0024202700|nr:DUF4279 domain-containing protein [Qipengyuania sp. XHP0207]MDG5747742.1 DUF4279 domain-containing protein [Qipengyuania sp. XHP0207]
MAELSDCIVTLGFWDDDLEPELFTELLECQPTVGIKKGEPWVTSHGRRKIAPTGSWRVEVDKEVSGNLETKIATVLSLVTQDLSRWKQLPESERAQLFCGLFMDDVNEGVGLSHSILQQISDRGLALELDLYGGSEG